MTRLIENVGDSLKYAWSINSKRIGRWILLLILTLIPIVDFIAVGAFLKIFKGEEPELSGNVGSCFVHGLLAFIAYLIYSIIPAIIGGIFVLLTNLLVGGIIGGILSLIATLLFLPAVANYAKTDKFGAFFRFGEIFKAIGKVGFLKYIGAWIVMLIIGLILGLLTIIPIFGWIVSILLFLLIPVVEAFGVKYWANLLE